MTRLAPETELKTKNHNKKRILNTLIVCVTVVYNKYSFQKGEPAVYVRFLFQIETRVVILPTVPEGSGRRRTDSWQRRNKANVNHVLLSRVNASASQTCT